jgi:hypothetical protein
MTSYATRLLLLLLQVIAFDTFCSFVTHSHVWL